MRIYFQLNKLINDRIFPRTLPPGLSLVVVGSYRTRWPLWSSSSCPTTTIIICNCRVTVVVVGFVIAGTHFDYLCVYY